MKNFALITTIILTFLCPLVAQYTTVQLDDNKNYFNDGQPLSSEKALMFTGELPDNIKFLEISVLPYKNKDNRVALYTTTWRMPADASSRNFSAPMNYKLRASEKYDFQFDYFRNLNQSEKDRLEQDILANISAYLDVNISGDKSIKLLKNHKKIMEGMNDILHNSLLYYRSNNGQPLIQFSDIVSLKLQKLESENLSKDFVKKDSTTTVTQVRNQTRDALVDDLKDQVNREITRMIDAEWMILDKTRIVDDYETESKQNFLSVSFGYGGAYLSGKVSENFDYGSSPYLGLSVPLGNSTFAPKILSNASFTLGAFTKNFENNEGREISGVLFNRPWYAGLDYKLFQFIRFNAGATFLQGVQGDGSRGEVSIRPFIGVGARLNLNFSLEK